MERTDRASTEGVVIVWKHRREEHQKAHGTRRAAMLCGADLLVAECESYLNGRYALDLIANDHPVPAWAWLGMLAHAPAQLLEAWAMEEQAFQSWSTDAGHWCQAVARLARELLETAAAIDEPVEDLQRAVLVPLELDPEAAATQGATPAQLVSWVLDDLDTFRPGTRH